MKRIAIIGAGQMGDYYSNILLNHPRVGQWDVGVFDSNPAKMVALASKYGFNQLHPDDLAHDAAIVAVSTPAHADVICALATAGTPYILSEKPLAMNAREAMRIKANCGTSTIYTALVISWSPALVFLRDFMVSARLTPLEFYGVWGKPRPLDKIKRPSPGDVEDEAIHPISAALHLIPREPERVSVVAQVGYLPFVDSKVQLSARGADRSFPKKPNHRTSAQLTIETQGGDVHVDILSSYLHAEQTRKVGGVLGRDGSPSHSFEISFDVKTASGTRDSLTIVDLVSGTKTIEEFASNKLADLTDSFIKAAQGDPGDYRLTDLTVATQLVKIADAILKSSRRGQKISIRY